MSRYLPRPNLEFGFRFLAHPLRSNVPGLIHLYSRQITLTASFSNQCYGGPFIVALVYLFIETPTKGKLYGPATLWCWIDIDWVAFRIALCYAPAWQAALSLSANISPLLTKFQVLHPHLLLHLRPRGT